MASDMDSGKPPSGVAIDQACPKQCHCHRSGSLHATKVALELIVGEFTGYCCDFMWSGQTGQGLPRESIKLSSTLRVLRFVFTEVRRSNWQRTDGQTGGIAAVRPAGTRRLDRRRQESAAGVLGGCITPPKILYILGRKELIVPIAVKPPKFIHSSISTSLARRTLTVMKRACALWTCGFVAVPF
uniref:Uncharacterized protein n=1 Tax=Oryza sativa subsp. japonica TaxID=39947 RepID=Q339A7_ORYSJ|nr:hypothetical protein LOC_Os10g22940 [Oryza sativa Japonica Group]